jgi:hypothetical protein
MPGNTLYLTSNPCKFLPVPGKETLMQNGLHFTKTDRETTVGVRSRYFMRALIYVVAALMATVSATSGADSAKAACVIYPAGEDHTDVNIPCTFSQRQGHITIVRSDGVSHDLTPSGDTPGNFTDGEGRTVYRQSGLADQGLIFRFPDESVYVYWNTKMLEPDDPNSPTWPFTTQDYNATALLRCRAAGENQFGSCPAGVLRMDDGQASVVVQNPGGEQFTINFMKDYVNASNRELKARQDGDTWILEFANGEAWEVPIAFIQGG